MSAASSSLAEQKDEAQDVDNIPTPWTRSDSQLNETISSESTLKTLEDGEFVMPLPSNFTYPNDFEANEIAVVDYHDPIFYEDQELQLVGSNQSHASEAEKMMALDELLDSQQPLNDSAFAGIGDNESMGQLVPLDFYPTSKADIASICSPRTSLIDVPTYLIEYWFKNVCSMWSAFDSDANPNRNLAASLWGSSRSVFYSLQSMSAACLAEHLPQLKEVVSSAPRLATEAIREDLAAFCAMSEGSTSFPSGLILSLFCMGTSVCWMNPQQLGIEFIRQAREVLKRLGMKSWALQEKEQNLLTFFNESLLYAEMLSSVICDDDDSESSDEAQLSISPSTFVQITPHPWTGVAPDVLRLFTKAMSLCRKSRDRWRRRDGMTVSSLQKALNDIETARAIEESLLAAETPALPAIANTGDKLTPQSHFQDVAEAYRLASLLQLYQTFPDLISRRLPTSGSKLAHSEWLAPLALHITRILERIPPHSGTRCIQPLLYISAGTGLRFDAMPSKNRMSSVTSDVSAPLDPSHGLDDFTSSFDSSWAEQVLSSGPVLTQTSVEISQARQFILQRLNLLEYSLPSKPVVVAKQLLQAVWKAYDEEGEQSSQDVHWLDVMMNTGLQSLFG